MQNIFLCSQVNTTEPQIDNILNVLSKFNVNLFISNEFKTIYTDRDITEEMAEDIVKKHDLIIVNVDNADIFVYRVLRKAIELNKPFIKVTNNLEIPNIKNVINYEQLENHLSNIIKPCDCNLEKVTFDFRQKNFTILDLMIAWYTKHGFDFENENNWIKYTVVDATIIFSLIEDNHVLARMAVNFSKLNQSKYQDILFYCQPLVSYNNSINMGPKKIRKNEVI